MVLNVSSSEIAMLINLALFVGQIAMIYFYRTVERRKSDAVITTNRALISSVTSLVETLQKVLEQRVINEAIAQARADQEEEFRID